MRPSVVPFLTLTWGLAACGSDWRELPSDLVVTEIVASAGSGILREGCRSVVYRLSDATAERLIAEGLPFFAKTSPPAAENPDNPYSGWRPTPIMDGSQAGPSVYAVQAIGGCGAKGGDFHGREIDEALRRPGSFYALTSNREGMMVVVPESRLAAFLYVG